MTDKDDQAPAVEPDLMSGPCMQALTEKRRAFVWAMISLPFKNATDWARAAGYKDSGNGGIKVRAHECLIDPKVQAAVQEVARATLGSEGPYVAMRRLIEIAKDGTHKDNAKAVEMILNRTGFSERQQIEITHTHVLSLDETLARIQFLSRKHGVDLSADLRAPPNPLALLEHKPANGDGDGKAGTSSDSGTE